jgi:hypothetical protein
LKMTFFRGADAVLTKIFRLAFRKLAVPACCMEPATIIGLVPMFVWFCTESRWAGFYSGGAGNKINVLLGDSTEANTFVCGGRLSMFASTE